jgi:hypothetical protein
MSDQNVKFQSKEHVRAVKGFLYLGLVSYIVMIAAGIITGIYFTFHNAPEGNNSIVILGATFKSTHIGVFLIGISLLCALFFLKNFYRALVQILNI